MRMRTMVVLVLAVTAAPLQAQVRSVTEGLRLNAHLTLHSMDIEDAVGEQEGGGLGIAFGWGFSPRWMVFLAADGGGLETEFEDDAGLGHIDLGVRYSFAGEQKRWVPYIEAALTGFSRRIEGFSIEGDDFEIEHFGSGLSLGGGVQYYLTSAWALDGALRITGGELSQVAIDGGDREEMEEEIDASTTRVLLGVSWYPMKRFR